MKKLRLFFSGMLAMALIIAMAGTALAAAGKLQVGTSGIVVMDQVRVKPGEGYAVNGKKIPAVVSYADGSGTTYNYLPVQMMADFLNVDVSWSEKRNSVVLGPTTEGINFDPSTYDPAEDPFLKENPTSPEKGAIKGPFTEIDPKAVKTSEKPVLIAEDKTRVQTVTGFSTGGYFNPERGKYIVLKVTNNGASPVTCLAGREMTLGGSERFRSVDIEAGRTLTRAFLIADGIDDIHGTFVCGVHSTDSSEANITVSLMQYK